MFNQQPSALTNQLWTNERTNSGTNERTIFGTNELWHERTNEQTNFGTNERTNQQTLERTNQPTNFVGTNERTNEPTNFGTNDVTNERTNKLWNERCHQQRTKSPSSSPPERTNERTNEQANIQIDHHSLLYCTVLYFVLKYITAFVGYVNASWCKLYTVHCTLCHMNAIPKLQLRISMNECRNVATYHAYHSWIRSWKKAIVEKKGKSALFSPEEAWKSVNVREARRKSWKWLVG